VPAPEEGRTMLTLTLRYALAALHAVGFALTYN
jgi:hypothetical protein